MRHRIEVDDRLDDGHPDGADHADHPDRSAPAFEVRLDGPAGPVTTAAGSAPARQTQTSGRGVAVLAALAVVALLATISLLPERPLDGSDRAAPGPVPGPGPEGGGGPEGG
ncbi:MAG: hypothetical protein AAF547_22750, partial [Actinomycetota bacterium]